MKDSNIVSKSRSQIVELAIARLLSHGPAFENVEVAARTLYDVAILNDNDLKQVAERLGVELATVKGLRIAAREAHSCIERLRTTNTSPTAKEMASEYRMLRILRESEKMSGPWLLLHKIKGWSAEIDYIRHMR